MEVGDRVREAREKRGMTQSELAAKLGISAITVTLWENEKNRRQVGAKYLKKIAEIFGMRMSELLGEPEAEANAQPTAIVTVNVAETQLLRLFRLMPEKTQLVQLAQFVESAGAGNLGGGRRDHAREDASSSVSGGTH
jgi:transcriptional regulator with XRE-family HTH domain